MDHDIPKIGAYADGELSAAEAREVEAHLATCASCTEVLARHRALSVALGHETPALAAPDRLRDAVRSALAREAARRPALPYRRLALAATVVVAVLSGWTLWRSRARRAEHAEVLAEVVRAHRESERPGHLTFVNSGDRATVSRWLAGVLAFVPPVENPMPDSFPLAGARIDYLHQRNVAALVYRHGDQVVNAFFWPEAGESGPTEETAVAGHPVFYWKHDGMEVWIVGDGSGAELERFVGRLREAMG